MRKMSRADLDAAYAEYNHRRSHYTDRYGRRGNMAEEVMGHLTSDRAVSTLTEGLAAGAVGFGLGYYQAQNNGMPDIAGISVDWWAAAGLAAAGLLLPMARTSMWTEQTAEKVGDHLIAGSFAALGWAAGNMGISHGCAARVSAGQAPCGTPLPAGSAVEPRFGPFVPTGVLPVANGLPGGNPAPGATGGAHVGAVPWNYANQRIRRAA